MAGYLGSKAVLLSTTAADVVGNAEIGGDLTVGGTFTSQGIDDNASATAMTLDASGNVGIGTSSPADVLHVVTPSFGGITLECTGATADPTFKFLGVSGNDWSLQQDASQGDSFQFRYNNSEKIRIDSSGNLLINCTSARTQGTGVSLVNPVLQVYGDIVPNIDAGNAGHSDLGDPSWRYEDSYVRDGVTTGSDQQEKNTINNSDLGLDFIKRLEPKSYLWNGGTRTHYGLMAQQVEAVLTDLGKTSTDFAGLIKNDYSDPDDPSRQYRYGLRYQEFIAPMMKAIQEQQATITALEARITALEAV